MRGKNLSPFDSIKINLTDFPIAERRSQNIQSIPLTEKYTRALGSSRRERERERGERERDKSNDPHNQVIGRDINHNYQ